MFNHKISDYEKITDGRPMKYQYASKKCRKNVCSQAVSGGRQIAGMNITGTM
jgi:hypothetical protein